MRESFGPDQNRILRAPEDGNGGSSDAESEKVPALSIAEWDEQIKAGEATRLPDAKGKKQRAEVAERVGEQAMASIIGKYKARDSVGFETAVKAYAQARARKAEEKTAILAARLKLNDDDIARFEKIIPIVNKRLERIGAIEPPKPMTEEELLRGLEGLSPEDQGTDRGKEQPAAPVEEKRESSGISLRQYPAPPTPEKKLKHAQATGGDEIAEKSAVAARTSVDDEVRDEQFARKPRSTEKKMREVEERLDQRLDRFAKQFDEQASADPENAATIFREFRDKISPLQVDRFVEKVREHGWAINGDVHRGDGQEPEQERGLETPYIGLRPLKTRQDFEREFGKSSGKIETLPFWILPDGDAGIVFTQGEGGQRVGKGGFLKIKEKWYEFNGQNFNEISEEEATRRRDEMKSTEVSRRRNPEDVSGKKEEPKQPTSFAEYVDLAPLKSYGDFVAKFGKPAPENIVYGVPFWILGDGDAALPGPSGGGGERVGKDGYTKIRDKWLQFDGTRFNSVSDEEAEKRERRSGNRRGGMVQERAVEPREDVDMEQPRRGRERTDSRENNAVRRANETFNRAFVPDTRWSLARAYADAAQGLTKAELEKFNSSLEARLTDIPVAMLRAVMHYASPSGNGESRSEEAVTERKRGSRQEPNEADLDTTG